MAKPLRSPLRFGLVPNQNVFPGVFGRLGAMDISPNPVLRPAESVLEDFDSCFAVHALALKRAAQIEARMRNVVAEVYSGLKSLLVGMRITISEFFKPTVTVHYPHETLKIPPR